MNIEDMVTIGSDSSFEADFKKMFLEQHGITVFLLDQCIGTIAPHIASYGGAGAVRIQSDYRIAGVEVAQKKIINKKMHTIE